jgi:exopolysaccharide production protein ExoQ
MRGQANGSMVFVITPSLTAGTVAVGYAAQAFALATSVIVLFMFMVWTQLLGSIRTVPTSDRGRVMSYALLAAFVLAPVIFGDIRGPNALLKEGLSRQNVAQAVVALAALAWAIWLIATRAISVSSLASGVNFWFGMMIVLYALSTAWSILPSMTVFRTIELGAFWVITVHLFSGRPPLAPLTWCLLATAMLMVFCGAVFGWPDYDPSRIFGRYDNNQSGLIAGALLVIIFSRLFILGEKRCLFLLPPSFTALILFGSLSSAIALLFATVTLLLFRLGRPLGKPAQLLMVLYVLLLIGFFSYELVSASPDAIAWIASVSEKNAEQLAGATGRVSLWEALWTINANNVLGSGFGAGERLIYFFYTSDWNPGSAHNGFLSAWLSAGWLAAWIEACLFLGVIVDAARQSYQDRAYRLSAIVFLVINNLSYPAVGSYFNTGCFVMMVLACAGPTPSAARSVEKFRHLYSLSRTYP